jgi:hypothetical protein
MTDSNSIRILSIIFNTSIQPYEVPAFRAAIANRVGREYEWFHNHNNQEEGEKDLFHHRYSLIQYKIKAGTNKQFHPMILVVGQSVKEVHELFKDTDWMLNIKGKLIDFSDYELSASLYDLELNTKQFYYNIYRWQPFKSVNFKEYQQLESQREKYEFLEKMMLGHLISFLQGVNWHPPSKIEVAILNIKNEKWISYKNVKVLCFDMRFKCNIKLPEFIGLGRAVSKGFGVLRHDKPNKRN